MENESLNLIPINENFQEVLDPSLFIISKSTDTRLELDSVEKVYDEDNQSIYRFEATWDGCAHLYVRESSIEDEPEYIHIDELDSFINHLIEFRNKAKKHFNNEYWT